jgi:hypothetical protein
LIYQFEELNKLFPEDVVLLREESKELGLNTKKSLSEKIYEIRRRINEKQIPVDFDFSRIDDENYLLNYALYDKSDLPLTGTNLLSFYLSNVIISYLILDNLLFELERLFNGMSLELSNYLGKKSNTIFRLFAKFNGHCTNIDQVIRDCNSFIILTNETIDRTRIIQEVDTERDIHGTQIPIRRRNIPSTSDMRINLAEVLLSHKSENDRSFNFALIRSYLEFAIRENFKLKLKYLMNHHKKMVNFDIIFTINCKFSNFLAGLRCMRILDKTDEDTFLHIYRWGNRSLHESQMMPIHLIWMCLFAITDRLYKKIGNSPEISEEEFEKLFNSFKGKIEIVSGTYISSHYDLY